MNIEDILKISSNHTVILPSLDRLEENRSRNVRNVLGILKSISHLIQINLDVLLVIPAWDLINLNQDIKTIS